MDADKYVVNPILLFLQKLLGRQLWILPLAIAIASWIVWKHFYVSFWILYVALIFTIITGLLISIRLSSYIFQLWRKYRAYRKAKHKQKTQLQQQAQIEERQKTEEASYIWKYVAHIDSDIISVASYLLELEAHDGNQFLRFIRTSKNYEDNQLIQGLIHASHYFSIPKTYPHSTYNLIKMEKVNNGVYFEINPYLYRLLKQYKERSIWKKI